MKYFALVTGFQKGYAYSEYERDSVIDHDLAEKCPVCGARVSTSPHLPPYNIFLSSKKLGDFIFGLFTYFIVSENFKEKYLNSKLSGIKEFRKIDRIRFRKEILDVDYYGIVPERVNVRLEPIESVDKKNERTICELCNPYGITYLGKKGLKMNLNGLDCTPDIFTTYTTGMSVFCNQRFIDFCKENKFTNLDDHIESFEDYELGCLAKIRI